MDCNFNSLEHLKNVSLKKLTLSDCSGLENIRLNELPKLVNLELKRCEGLTSIKQGQDSIGLRQLKIGNCSKLRELAVAASSDLKALEIEGADSFERFDSLANLQQLQSLKLTDCDHLLQLEFNQPMQLVSIHVEEDRFRKFRSDGLERLDELVIITRETETELELGGCQSLKSLKLQSMPLNYKVGDPGISVGGMGAVHTLEKVELLNIEAHTVFELLSANSRLEDLQLDRCDVVTLDGLPNLRRVSLGRCAVKSLDALAGSQYLEELEIGFCTGLNDIEAVLQLPTLKRVDIDFSEPLLTTRFDRREKD